MGDCNGDADLTILMSAQLWKMGSVGSAIMNAASKNRDRGGGGRAMGRTVGVIADAQRAVVAVNVRHEDRHAEVGLLRLQVRPIVGNL